MMINRIYIDNYRCFVNFECQPNSLELLLGENGSGKTTIADILETLREFVTNGVTTNDAFPTHSLTAWDRRNEQTFEIGLCGNGGSYLYHLVVDHDRTDRQSRIKSETLRFEQKMLYEFDGNDAHLYRDDGSAGPVFPFDWSRSAISTIPERKDNQLLSWFRRRMERVYVFTPDPLRMSSHSEQEMKRCDRHLHKLASWLRHLLRDLDTMSEWRDSLREAIPGLVNFRIEDVGEAARVLKFEFEYCDLQGSCPTTEPFRLPLDDLSDGQKNLVGLFTILHAAVRNDATVCIDEPDNYLGLREIQPWLSHLRDRVEDSGCQCLLISHHPELINYLAAHHGLMLSREGLGPVRAKRFEWTENDVIAPAELIARGWE